MNIVNNEHAKPEHPGRKGLIIGAFAGTALMGGLSAGIVIENIKTVALSTAIPEAIGATLVFTAVGGFIGHRFDEG